MWCVVRPVMFMCTKFEAIEHTRGAKFFFATYIVQAPQHTGRSAQLATNIARQG